MVHVRLTDPLLNDDIRAFLAGALPVRIRERRNVLTIEFTGEPSDLEAQIHAVRRITSAWQAAGHLNVRAEVLAA
jgi:hypothetical protein